MARNSGSGIGKFILGFVCAILVLVLGVFLYFRYGAPPVAVADAPFPFEKLITHVPLDARIGREVKQPPFGTDEAVFEAGAHIYHQNCAECHGIPGKDAQFGKMIYPHAPQLWKKHASGNVVGVSDDDAGETYWKIDNGIRLTGMPSYKHALTETQMWQVTLLLKNADQPLPDPVEKILTAPETTP